jgi:hypothetical protein
MPLRFYLGDLSRDAKENCIVGLTINPQSARTDLDNDSLFSTHCIAFR